MTAAPALVERYIELGLRLGRHIDGMVDAYYGPPAVADRVAAEPLRTPAALADDARRLLADLEVDGSLDPHRRRWLEGQARGLRVTAGRLAGEAVAYSDEVEACYGVRPRWVDEEVFERAHRRLDAVLPGSGALSERYPAWREAQAVPVDVLPSAIDSLSSDLRERTASSFGLPEGEHVDFELVRNQPWAGFNYYLGGLRSRVAINIDLPVLSPTLAHLVAHEAYPGHHTEHSRKEVGLVRRRDLLEETIFLVGTPQCLLAEGLADLGLEVVMGERPEADVASHLRPLGVPYDAEVAASVAEATVDLLGVRGNVGLLLHERSGSPEDAVEYAARWLLLPSARAEKLVSFMLDATWRAYTTCYVEGYPLCRSWVAGSPERFERLISDQLLPSDLANAA